MTKFQVKNAKFFFVVLIFIVGFGAFLGMQLQVNPDFSILIPHDSEFNSNDRMLKNAFEADTAMVLYYSVDESSSLSNAPSTLEGEDIVRFFESVRETVALSQYVVEVSPVIYSDDLKAAQIIASVSTPNKVGGTAEVKEEIEFLMSQVGEPVGVKSVITGFPVMLDRISSFLIEDNLNTILITIIAIFLILYWYSRDFFFTFVTLAIPVISLILLAAFMVFFGIEVSITLAAVGVLALGLGVDYSIHISTHYAKARESHESHELALIHTIKELQLPITASFITTLAGFGALIFGLSPSSQAQGIVLGLAITIIYVVTMLVFPVLITVFAKRIDVKNNYVFDKIVLGLGNFSRILTSYSKIVVWIFVFVTIIMIYGGTKVEFSTSNSNWIPDDDPVSNSFREVVYKFGGHSEIIDILLISKQGDLRSSAVARDVGRLVAQIENIPNVDRVDSVYSGVGFDSNVLFDEFTNNEKLRGKFNSDWTLTRILVVSQNPGRDDAGNSILLSELRGVMETNPIYHTDMTLYGDAVRFEELGKSLQKDTMVTTVLGLGLVFFIASAVYVSISIGILALVPIVVAVIWAVGMMGFFRVPFTSLSTGIISLVLGIGVDFSIHLVDGIKKNARRMMFDDAVFETMTVSGKAIFLSSLTTFVGFLALTFAKLLGTQRLGWSLAFSILSVFLVTMTLVPAVMKLLYGRDKKKNNRNKYEFGSRSLSNV